MAEKRMLVLPEELVKKIENNRGDLSYAEFLTFLIDNALKEAENENGRTSSKELGILKQEVKTLLEKVDGKANKEDFKAFQQDTKKLLKSFVDFFIGYGLELGKQSGEKELDELSQLLNSVEQDQGEGGGHGRDVKIKWK